MRLTELKCRKCRTPLEANDIVEKLALARCSHCKAVFSLQPEDSNTASGDRALRPAVEMPAGIQVRDVGSALEISHSWFNISAYFLVIFCIFWNGFMVVWHTISWSTGAWFMSVFGLLHTAVGLGLIYYTVALFLNKTRIRVGNGMIEVSIKPVPWSGNKWLTADDLTQLYCREQTRRGKNGVHYTYDVMTVRKDNVSATLVEGLQESDQALFIEQEIERFLHIQDQPVRGEIGR